MNLALRSHLSVSDKKISNLLCLSIVLLSYEVTNVYSTGNDSSLTSVSVTCNRAGSKSSSPDPAFGTCLCKNNVIGSSCDTCKPGTIDLQEYHENGCVECTCSGVTSKCHLAEFMLTQIRAPFEHGLILLRINGTENKISSKVEVTKETNTAFYNSTESSVEFYWELPFEFIGNKIKSYGKYLRWTQNYAPSIDVSQTKNPHLLIIGTEETLTWIRKTVDTNETVSVQLDENSLMKIVNDTTAKATRADVMKVLASIEYVRIRASVQSSPANLFLANVTMDVVATKNETSIVGSTKIEVCQCPKGHTGTSCESCEKGYFKSVTHAEDRGICQKCPCNDREVDCWLKVDNNKPVCNCHVNYTGQHCEELITPPSIYTGPSNVTEKEGSTVSFDCIVANTSETYKEWLFDQSFSPSATENNETWKLELRKKKHYYGANVHKDNFVLELRDITIRDEGWYTCEVYNSMGMDKRGAYLKVDKGKDNSALQVMTPECLKVATAVLTFLCVLILIPIAFLWFLKYRIKKNSRTVEEAELQSSPTINFRINSKT